MPAPISIQFAVAVHVLTYLASATDHTPVGSPELAGSVDATPEYIRRVMIPLRAAGIVTSAAGKNGGWRLERDPSTLTLAEVWQLVHVDEPTLRLHAPNPTCTIGRSVSGSLVEIERDLADAALRRLGETTIGDLLEAANVG